MEKTLAMIKPDMFQRKLVGEGLSMIEKKFTILNMKLVQFSEAKARLFYEEHVDKSFFKYLSKHICADRCLAIILAGENVIKNYREFIGATNPTESLEGTARKKFGLSLDQNSFHGSDSINSAEREIEILFG